MKTRSITPVRKLSPSRKRSRTPRRTASNDSALRAVPPHLAWHYRRLSDLRDRIVEEYGSTLRHLAQPIEAHGTDLADSATEELDHDLALHQLTSEQVALFEVEAAMRRIINGTYGVCEQTGKRIPVERLRAIPWTRYCAEAKKQLEREGKENRLN